jgi:hypothetical protein
LSRSIFFCLGAGFAKALEIAADLRLLNLMKFLVSQMAGLKLRLLEKIVQTKEEASSGVLPLSNQRIEPDKMTVCKAVEDRICKRIDLASRTDLTDQQLTDALCLLLKIVRQSDLPIDFSSGEILLLTRGVSERSCPGKTDQRERATFRFKSGAEG